jgi:hypothetical protein
MTILRSGDSGGSVKELQELLREAGFTLREAEFGRRTEATVKKFQKICGIDDDGVVGPITWNMIDKYIQSDFVCLPDGLPGIYKYFGSDPKDRDKWGTREMIQMIKDLGSVANAMGVEIGVGDISLRIGGPFTNYKDPNEVDHGSHKSGKDVDIRPLRKDGKRVGVTCKNKGAYDGEITYKIVKEGINIGFSLVLFNDPEIYKALKEVKYYRNHNNHLHMRIL